MGEFTNSETEALLIRIADLSVDEQILEVKRAMRTSPEILANIAMTAWLEIHKDRIIELAQQEGWPTND